jgi:hypothetical protein
LISFDALPLHVSSSNPSLSPPPFTENLSDDDRKFELWYAMPEVEKLTFQAKTLFAKLAWLSELKAILRAKGAEDFEMPSDERPQMARSASEERRMTFKKRPSQVGGGGKVVWKGFVLGQN